jgi:divalent metal cation (Fe/Co/Zn/Cd) transporter
MDSVLGVLCVLAIFYAAFQVLKESASKVLGEKPKQEIIDKIINEVDILCDFDLKLHHFHLHDYISQKELTLHMMVEKDMTVEKGHEIATAIEDMIMEKFGMEATIHIEPLEEQ